MPAKAPRKKTSPKKPAKSFEETLWHIANKLHRPIKSSEYKQVFLSLIFFFKFVSDKFEQRWAEFVTESKDDNLAMVEFYTLLPKLISGALRVSDAEYLNKEAIA